MAASNTRFTQNSLGQSKTPIDSDHGIYRDRHAFPISRPSVCATPLITNHDIKLPFPPTSVSPRALLCICKLPK